MAARLSIPTLGTFVSPFVRLVLISPSQPRKTTAAFSRLYAPSSFSLLAGRSLSRCRPSHCHALAPSICLSLPISSPISFSFSLLIRLAAASVSASRRAALEAIRSSCFPLARSRARSSPSFQLFVSYFIPRRLSALHSSLFPTIQLQPASLARSRDSPATEETTHVCALPLPCSHTTALLLVQRYFMQIRSTEFRSALQCRGSIEKSQDHPWAWIYVGGKRWFIVNTNEKEKREEFRQRREKREEIRHFHENEKLEYYHIITLRNFETVKLVPVIESEINWVEFMICAF